MRIHRLEIQAFGPFAERQHIDFDALTEQGLFLLNGPTGAGKSSVLDAICYALYGSVPGARQNARRLRSDHAPEGLTPEVVCEFSAGSRRFEVTRNPSWDRPSKRGSGTTTEQARTLLRERVAGEWVTRSTRNDEAGAELQNLLGMNREQFTRVVMLPQGEFAAFLRSDATSRGELLQRLFATDRFSVVEQLLVERAARAGAQLQEAEAQLEDLLVRAADEVQRHGLAVDEDPAGPEQAGGGELKVPTANSNPGSGPGLAVLRERLTGALAEGRDGVKELARLRDAAAQQRSALEAERHDRLAFRSLMSEAESNDAALKRSGALRSVLENHRRAQILEGPLTAREEAAAQLRRHRERLEAALRGLREDPAAGREVPAALTTEGTESLTAVEAAHELTRERLAEARAALPLEQDLADVGNRMREVQRLLESQVAGTQKCVAAQEQFGQELADIESQLGSAETAAGRAPQVATQCADAEAKLKLLAEAEAAELHLQELDARQQDHQASFLMAKEDWLRKLQLRLEQTAAELAARMHDGEPCPVCGSEEHPSPATPGSGALVTRDEEERARVRQDVAEDQVKDITRERNAAALIASGLRARCGETTAEELQDELSALRQELAVAEQAVNTAAHLHVRRTTVEARLSELAAHHSDLTRRHAEESSRLASLHEQEAALTARLAAQRGAYPSVADKVTVLAALEQHLGAVCSAMSRCAQAEENAAAADAALDTRLAATDFASPEAVREALLNDTAVADAERAIREAENTAHRIERDLQRAENVAAAALETDGNALPTEEVIAAAARDQAETAGRLEQAVLEVGLLEQSVVQLDSYVDRAAVLEERLEPLRHAHHLAKSVADTARGNGENLYKMSLATYVLAARLEQVADAATERLQQMSDGRYSLVHSDSKSGNRKSGLGLNVIDSWTGVRRDTSTLSGGESFMASLALALGLADVVQQESGGLDIETLFVDEGFGSLDEQSLEQVMDALENLRDGGRVVGLVSHVAELKQRIPAQLHVLKGRAGSTVRFVNQLQRV